MTTNIDYHSLTENEQQQAVDLWHQIFPQHPPGFYKRYHTSAASYHDGDSPSAWCDGQLVSAMHICRLTLRNEGETYLCGGIANVATVPDYRERGISRHLLEQAIDKMKNEGFAFSALHSARHSHYEHVGYEQCSLSRRILIDLNRTIDDASSISSKFDWKPVDVDEEIINIYAKQPRVLQVTRSRQYFKEWVNWNWQIDNSILHVIPNEGYIVLNKNTDNDICSVSEWRAINRQVEEQLLLRASYKARQLNSTQIQLAATPILVNQQWLEENLGTIVKIEEDKKTMIRNINLTTDQFDKVRSLYSTGEATMWPADYF
jgi:predicted acetyltransferase